MAPSRAAGPWQQRTGDAGPGEPHGAAAEQAKEDRHLHSIAVSRGRSQTAPGLDGWRGGRGVTIIIPKLFSQMRKPAETPHTRPVQRLLAGQCWTLDLNPLFAPSPYSWLWR